MNPDINLPKLSVLDSEMAYREAGKTDAPVALLLHGNPTSSYLWRNVIPHVAEVAHCIAPDLIGFGQSGKPDIAYRFEDHVRYLDAFIAKAGIGSAYLVAHDWGTALAFHLAARRPEFVRGLAFFEFMWSIPTWEEFARDSASREIFRKFRTPGEGERLILEENAFVERVLPGSIVRKLTGAEMAVYRAPFSTPQSRRPTWPSRTNFQSPANRLTWLRRLRRRTRVSLDRPIQSFSSRRIPVPSFHPSWLKISPISSMTAGWSNSVRASTFFKRIIRRRSGNRLRNLLVRSKPVEASGLADKRNLRVARISSFSHLNRAETASSRTRRLRSRVPEAPTAVTRCYLVPGRQGRAGWWAWCWDGLPSTYG
jgi:pimeloyl-ACP methyl ester carboxylesterase